jgi:hypothetical protein
MSTPGDEDPIGGFDKLDRAQLDRLVGLLRNQLPLVFKANRIIEQRTGFFSEAGRDNLVDALSHLGTLVQRAGELSVEKQSAQVSKFEEHLRRAVMEAPEEVVRARLVEIKGRWDEYQRESGPYRRDGTLRGVPSHEELERQRERIDKLMEDARSRKADECSWDDWLDGAAEMTEAARVAEELKDKLEQCIGEALRMTREAQRDTTASQRDRKSVLLWVVALAVSIALAVGAYLVGREQTRSTSASPARPAKSSAPLPKPATTRTAPGGVP